MSRSASPLTTFAPWGAAAALVLIAIAWGGGTSRTAQIAVLAGIGLLLASWPHPQRPGRIFVGLAAMWLVWTALAWLPAAWFPQPEWRSRVLAAGIALPTTVTPQPELTLEAGGWLFAGLAWMGWLSAAPGGHRVRRWTATVLAAGLICMAGVALLAWQFRWTVPGWLADRGFGPFPNRNHTGHVFALGGLLALACAGEASRRRPLVAIGWLSGALILVAALAVNYSRGGILLFFGSAALWAGLAAWQRRSWKTAALAGSGLLVGIAAVLLWGGPIAERFAGGTDSEVAFRVRVWRDTLAMISAAPWCGEGLGNFRGLFPFFRDASVIQQAVWHPESDWLWLAAESSWIGVLLAAAIVGVLLKGSLPLTAPGHGPLRTAALAAFLGALLHSLIDVPGHRLGAALLALLVLALARAERSPGEPVAAMRWVWRACGALLLGLAGWQAGLQASRATASFSQDRAVARAPLDWQAYYARALSLAGTGHTFAALADFRRARLLEPHFAGLPLEEGRFWAGLVPELALPAWQEALRRAPSADAAELYRAMFNAAPRDPAFRAELLALVESRPDLQSQWFLQVPPEEARPHLVLLRRLTEQVDSLALKARRAEVEALARP